jgi:hypothetical protein
MVTAVNPIEGLIDLALAEDVVPGVVDGNES